MKYVELFETLFPKGGSIGGKHKTPIKDKEFKGKGTLPSGKTSAQKDADREWHAKQIEKLFGIPWSLYPNSNYKFEWFLDRFESLIHGWQHQRKSSAPNNVAHLLRDFIQHVDNLGIKFMEHFGIDPKSEKSITSFLDNGTDSFLGNYKEYKKIVLNGRDGVQENRNVKSYDNFLNEDEQINLIVLPLPNDAYRLDVRKDAELGITPALSDDEIAVLLDKKYGKGKWFKRVQTLKSKQTDATKQIDTAWKTSHTVTEAFELKEEDGEWLIIGPTSKLFGKKQDLEGLMKYLKESEETIKTEFSIKPVGMEDDKYCLTINGKKYAYVAKEDSGLTTQQIGEKFVKMMKYSAGRALNWLKKRTMLAEGSVEFESLDIFILENLFESKDIIDDQAIDMLDFYGGKLPNSYEKCTKYMKVRDITDMDTLKDIYITAQMLQDDVE